MWIVILELIMNVKYLKIINTIEVTTNELELASKLFKTAEGPLRTYSHNELMVINRETRKNQKYRILPFGAVSEIRSLKLNHKKIKNSKQHITKQKGVNPDNLTHVQTKKILETHNNKLKIATVNTQSIRNKEL